MNYNQAKIRDYLQAYLGDLDYQFRAGGIEYVNSCTASTQSFETAKECEAYMNELQARIETLPEDAGDDFIVIGAMRDYETGDAIEPSIQFAIGDASPHALIAITDNWTGTPTFCGTRDGQYWEILRKEELLNL